MPTYFGTPLSAAAPHIRNTFKSRIHACIHTGKNVSLVLEYRHVLTIHPYFQIHQPSPTPHF
jgi:hypothetical protein